MSFSCNRYDEPEIINIGVGEDITISELAELIRRIVGFQGEIIWDTGKPDGTPRKLLDVGRLNTIGLAGADQPGGGSGRNIPMV